MNTDYSLALQQASPAASFKRRNLGGDSTTPPVKGSFTRFDVPPEGFEIKLDCFKLRWSRPVL